MATLVAGNYLSGCNPAYDVNKDKTVDYQDLELIATHMTVVNPYNPYANSYNGIYDMDCNKSVDEMDIVVCWLHMTVLCGRSCDVNNDSEVNYQDAGLIWVHREGVATYNATYDLDCDNNVDFVDAEICWGNR
jgi:hypothetical protein